jgi:signal transduction histidine kinase/FixJ family two-component response regulator
MSRLPAQQIVHYAGLALASACALALLLALIHLYMSGLYPADRELITATLIIVFCALLLAGSLLALPFIRKGERLKEAQAQAARENARLIEEIARRERAEQALQEAKETAESGNLAKSKYVRGISHELRTPLNAVLGYAQLLENNPAIPEHLKHSIRVIRRSSEHLSSLVDGLLDISMIEAGRLQIYRDEIPLTEFLRQIGDMIRLQAREKNLDFQFETPADLPELVYSDEKRLRQILINLLSNAVRCTHSGHILFRVSYSGGHIARFDIEDTGVGIPPADIERIFRPFERLESSISSKTGSGLGLTITKLLTSAMGGEINVESEPGKGSRFSVRLLLSPVYTPTRTRAAAEQPPTGYLGKRRTILVTDDDSDHVGFMREALSRLGFIVLTAEDGPTCLKVLETTPVDMLLLDISMPGMDGWQVAERARAFASFPIVMISADPRREIQRAIHAGHHDAYLMKPLVLATLLKTIQPLLGLEWHHEAVAATSPIRSEEKKILSLADWEDLHHLGQIGHARGILKKLDDIQKQTPEAEAAVRELRLHAQEFDFEGYGRALERMKA